MKALPRAVLDACVLYPMYLRDTLLRFAEAGFFMPVWSATILDELARALRRHRLRANVERVTRLIVLLDTHPAGVRTLLVRQVAAYERPMMTVRDLAGILRSQAPTFAQRIDSDL